MRFALVAGLAMGMAACASHKTAAPLVKAERTTRYDIAIARYTKLRDENPQDLQALLGLSSSLRHAGRGDEAVAALEHAQKAFGGNADYLTELGKANLVASKPLAAREALTKAIEQDARNWQAYAALGVANDLERHHAEAAKAYNSALGLCPDSAAILNNLALSEGLSGNVARSVSLLTQAARLQPNSRRIQQNLTAFRRIQLNCIDCGPQAYARLASTIYPQDWTSAGDGPACANGVASAQTIQNALDQKNFVDLRVHFAFDSAVLTSQAKEALDQLAAAMITDEMSPFRFRLEGHTDAVGTDAYNLDLSNRRAAAVKAYLVAAHKIDAARLDSVGFGESKLADPAHPKSGINRRVRVVKIEPMPAEPLAGL